ncbi:uncharacterized protein M421DRAFT_420447 [Didymella exigua CBS 183.55]|uniref:Uncharacterized protein n=1 Tax=Didymella exigua CBS 183.55 TaxID=1150837 RepID=A0A6A5RMQ1_9PLEO|nr:uncharacterized protein M421DRAFT_420447 [Didymella exigua CBS 183.55]KAF1928560.1 hypothetical protein M421DRAFT_420447 [Didymella exigua CBS 183.55]
MATSSNKATKMQVNRLPAPALFVGPPSHNASNTSLLSPTTEPRSPTKAPLVRQRSLLAPDAKRPLPPTTDAYDGDHLSLITSDSAGTAPFVRRQRQQSRAADAEAASRAEAIWAEMQNTLEEVELSAIRRPGMTVFGSEHSRALDELRSAQIELAKAWARSDDDGESAEQQKNASDAGSSAPPAKMTSPRGGSSPGKGDKLFDRARLEEETEKDIELSRKRREENDRYFEKVNRGVQEVVARLEQVAKAMRSVENESNEIWGRSEHDSAETASVHSTVSLT